MPPAADLDVDETLVRRLLVAQHGDLAALPLRPAATGWDNAVYRLGRDLAVRVPRRSVAAELVRHEQQTLPAIAARVPIAVPAPVRIGVPGPDYPYPWSVVPWFEGRTAAQAGLRDDRLARDLARFLRALHTPASGAPANPVRGVPLRDRASVVEERLAALGNPTLRTVWAEALAAPAWSGRPVWLHGDPHPANLIVRDDRLIAVIDFGDVTAGDPATDLAAGWLVLDAPSRRVFQSSYPVDAATWLRARGWALTMAAAMVTASEEGSVTHAIGVRAFANLVEDQFVS